MRGYSGGYNWHGGDCDVHIRAAQDMFRKSRYSSPVSHIDRLAGCPKLGLPAQRKPVSCHVGTAGMRFVRCAKVMLRAVKL